MHTEQLADDVGFASSRYAQALHAVTSLVREMLDPPSYKEGMRYPPSVVARALRHAADLVDETAQDSGSEIDH